MVETEQALQDLRSRVDRLESQVVFLSRRMSIEMQGIPNAEISPQVSELVKEGKTAEATRQFVSGLGRA